MREGVGSILKSRYIGQPPIVGVIQDREAGITLPLYAEIDLTLRRPLRYTPSRSAEPPPPMADYIEGATWWIARSRYSALQLARRFENQNVACLLYEQTGAIVELGRTQKGQYLIGIQIVHTSQEDWALDLSLTDAGIYLEEPWSPE